MDPYRVDATKIKAPPSSFLERLKFLGPGFILSATIVGSGELIATTTLGAKAGFVTFWVILVSCLVKVAIQVQFAKYTILTGETAMAAMNKLPGLRIGPASWSIYLYLIIMLLKLFQIGGIIGGVALVLNMVIPGIPALVWTFILAPVTSLLVFRGYYGSLEKISLILIAGFTIFALASVYFLQFTPYAITLTQITSGLTFSLPPEAVLFAFGAFGITGIGGEEIVYYNYWCLEKGYAAFTGPRDDSPAWHQRAKGWIKVMYTDAVSAMVLYTVVTAAFYLLGAAVLHARSSVPEGYDLLRELSGIFTVSLGSWAHWFFMAGAFMVLYSTLFSALAAWTRLYADIFGRLGWIDFDDLAQRSRTIAILSWIFPLLWALLFLFIELPTAMVLSGGIAGSILLILIVYVTWYFRYRTIAGKFENSSSFDLLFWLSIVAIMGVSVYGVAQLF